ncbi:MAG: hypothetical protein ACR2QS_09470 [Woeseiaceae bacterium]
MRKTIYSVAAATLLLISTSASADVAQVWRCSFADGVGGDALEAISKEWLDAAKEIDDDVSISAFFPVAADADEGNYIFVVYLPTFAAWGAFMDAYPDSDVEEVDSRWNEVGPCDISGLWATEDFE